VADVLPSSDCANEEARATWQRWVAHRAEIRGPRPSRACRVTQLLRELDGSLLIRAPTSQEVEAAAAIKYARQDELYRDYGSIEEHHRSLRTFCSPAFVEGLLTDRKSTLLIAQSSAQLLGLGAITPREDHSWLHSLYASRSQHGIGAAILDALIDVARARRHDSLRCGVLLPNTPGHDFLAHRGFVACRQIPSASYSKTSLVEYRYELDGREAG
jgi:GNAT superfamily N-acetyltransferase